MVLRCRIRIPADFPLPSPLRNRFYSISHSHRQIFTTLGEMTDADKLTKPQHFGSDPANIRVRIRNRIPDHLVEAGRRGAGLRSLSTLYLFCSRPTIELISHCVECSFDNDVLRCVLTHLKAFEGHINPTTENLTR